MNRIHALLAVALAGLVGCADLAPPRILHPGSEEYQQNRAQRFDPYPMTDVAPDVVGGRPLQYIKPAPENERMQNESTFEERYHQNPPPGIYRPPRQWEPAGGRVRGARCGADGRAAGHAGRPRPSTRCPTAPRHGAAIHALTLCACKSRRQAEPAACTNSCQGG